VKHFYAEVLNLLSVYGWPKLLVDGEISEVWGKVSPKRCLDKTLCILLARYFLVSVFKSAFSCFMFISLFLFIP